MTRSPKKMNVLFLTQVLPYPLTGGAKIRAYFMLRSLAQHHRVTLVSFVRQDDGQVDIDHLRQFCEGVYTVPMKRTLIKDVGSLLESVVRDQPLVIIRDRISEMESLLTDLLRSTSFDIVHADQTSMAQYAIFAQDAAHREQQPRILLDQHNALHLVVQRQAQYERGRLKRFLWKREARLLADYETQLMRKFDEILTVTENDRAVLLKLLDEEKDADRSQYVSVVPICVDPANQPLIPYHAATPQIIHLGTMFWPPNIEGVLWFANQVLPTIIAEVPDVSFVIAGKNPPPEILMLAEEGSPIKEHVRVTGFVADAEPLLASSKAFVVPLLAGGGMRVKILDAWQWGLPIISTAMGAEGILVRPGENIMLADDPRAFADAVIHVLTDSNLAGRLRINGRRWVEQHYDWRKTYEVMDGIYNRLATRE